MSFIEERMASVSSEEEDEDEELDPPMDEEIEGNGTSMSPSVRMVRISSIAQSSWPYSYWRTPPVASSISGSPSWSRSRS